MTAHDLFTPVRLGAFSLRNRMVMAPMTRMRAAPGGVPTADMARYYAQRASAGLIVTEATSISVQGSGCLNAPGIHTDAQRAGWRQVVKEVHEAGGLFFLQLWHMGRISHPSFQAGGALPVAPSAIAPRSGRILTVTGMQDYVAPRALDRKELPHIVAQYVAAAHCALSAGCDGVEIHNANGYLLDQFLRDGTNHRSDEYGGSIANRCRLTIEVAEAVTQACGAGRVGIRFSPSSSFNDMSDTTPLPTFRHVLRELNQLRLAYVHVITASDEDVRHGGVAVPLVTLRRAHHGPMIAANGFDRASATRLLAEGGADAVAFGRLFLANPDLPERFRADAPLNAPDESTFYGGTSAGYTDYPSLGTQPATQP
ncbi:MAG: alkene reductase [Candidatus Eisenbacteria bacterium]|nr:alkene reductase [Candidatus Eisenbacteria bacterium]